jgi:hypothetical protein
LGLGVLVGALVVAAPAKASVNAQDATTAPPMVTIVMSRSEISAADNMIGSEPTGTCKQDDKNITPLYAPNNGFSVAAWVAANAPKVHLTGSIETGVTQDDANWCAHYGRSFGPSWSQLEALGSEYGMHFISHSADYPQVWTTVPSTWVDPYGGSDRLADWQNWETCGSRDAITQHGLLGALGQYDWPNQKTDPTVMANDVIPCFYMNRSYQGTTDLNTLASVQANDDIATTRQLLGGRCNVVDLPCSTLLPECATCRYTVPVSVINQINFLKPGQALNLQAYVLVRNSNPDVTTGVNQYKTNADQWDCTNPNPAYHWSNDAERYCWVDLRSCVNRLARQAAGHRESNAHTARTSYRAVICASGRTATAPRLLAAPDTPDTHTTSGKPSADLRRPRSLEKTHCEPRRDPSAWRTLPVLA